MMERREQRVCQDGGEAHPQEKSCVQSPASGFFVAHSQEILCECLTQPPRLVTLGRNHACLPAVGRQHERKVRL